MVEWVGLEDVLAEAQALGFLGPASLESHLQHARCFLEMAGEAIGPGACLLDLGSGGGIPGLVVAFGAPFVRVVLLEGSVKRSTFLRLAVEQLGLRERVDVLPERAEVVGRQAGWRGRFDAVLARGFGQPAVTAECAAPLLRVGGVLVVSEPPDGSSTERRWPPGGCALLGLVVEERRSAPRAFVRLRAISPCGERFPRRTGVPAKRPLF